MSFKCFFNSHFFFVSQIHISFLQGNSFRFAVIIDAILDGGARAEKLSEGEVSGEEHLLHPLQF